MKCDCCGTKIIAASWTVECVEVDVCADGYDIDEELWPFTLQPKSGSRETVYIPGCKTYRAEPCHCPISASLAQSIIETGSVQQ